MKLLSPACLLFALCSILGVGTNSALWAKAPQPSSQQMPPQALSAVRAQAILSAYLLAPDTSLAAPPTLSTDDNGRSSYVFSGSGGGTYTINALTGEKDIYYSALYPVDGPETPSVHLSEAMLSRIAVAYVARHFPHYTAGMFRVSAPHIDVSSDADEYFVHFDSYAVSGARLPLKADVTVLEDSGAIKRYTETCPPTTISTTPVISQSQAVHIGQNWIVQNESTDPRAGQFQTDLGGDSPVEFFVSVDPLRNQMLVYKISYLTTVLTIDAQSGEVINQDFYAGGTPKLASGPGKNPRERETPLKARLTSGGDRLNHSAIWTQGQAYVWSGYLSQGGIQVSRKSSTIILHCGSKQIMLTQAKVAEFNNRTVWLRRGTLYIPLSAIQTLNPKFIKPSGFGGVLLSPLVRSLKH